MLQVTLKYSPCDKIICTIAIYKERNNIVDIRIFSKYYQLSLKDKVIPIRCGLDSDHPGLVPNLSDDDRIFLYCLGCSYKMFPGKELYDNIEFVLEELEVNEED